MNKRVANIICYVLPLPVLIASLFIGASVQTSFPEYVTLLYKDLSSVQMTASEAGQLELLNTVIYNVRMPRVLLTFIIGAALATSGSVLQGIFRNPLVDSNILGISAGAAFGAALAITYSPFPVNLAAFLAGCISVLLTYMIAASPRQASIISVVLSGMIISGIFMALLTVLQYISNPYKLQAIVQWSMGNLHAASWIELRQAYLLIIITLIIVFIFRWRINLLSLGDDAAKAVGVNPVVDKLVLISCATLMTATSVAAAGIIAMYGLFLPHMVRMMLGADNTRAIPGNIFFGGTFLLIIDNFSRALLSFEIPVGVFTMLLGGPFFIYLMKKNKLNWN